MLFSVILYLATQTLAIPNPNIKEILLAHSVPSEFKSTHLSPGLKDIDWFRAAHSLTAPNPPQSLAAKAEDQGVLKTIFSSFASNSDDIAAKTSMKSVQSLTDEGKDSLRMAVKMTVDMAKTDPSFHQDSLDLIKYAKEQGLDVDSMTAGKSNDDASDHDQASVPSRSAQKSKSSNGCKKISLAFNNLALVASVALLFL